MYKAKEQILWQCAVWRVQLDRRSSQRSAQVFLSMNRHFFKWKKYNCKYICEWTFHVWTGQCWWLPVIWVPSPGHGKYPNRFVPSQCEEFVTWNSPVLHSTTFIYYQSLRAIIHHLYLQVAELVTSEFFEQGDRERSELKLTPAVIMPQMCHTHIWLNYYYFFYIL